jgi:hypothetical protein
MKFNQDNSIELNLQNFVSGLLSSNTKSDEYPKGEVEKVINLLINDHGDVSLQLRPNSRLPAKKTTLYCKIRIFTKIKRRDFQTQIWNGNIDRAC